MMRREAGEELGVEIKGINPYVTYDYEDQRVENFLIEISSDIEIAPGNEITDIMWYSSKSTANTASGFKHMVLPRLLEDDLID